MPGESEVANGQVPQLQVQNEDNETVIIQNGGPKKVREKKIVFFDIFEHLSGTYLYYSKNFRKTD